MKAVGIMRDKAAAEPGSPHPKAVTNRRVAAVVVFSLVVLLVWLWGQPSFWLRPQSRWVDSEPTPSADEDDVGEWGKITPSEKLSWSPCFGSFLCARLTVPMDYRRPLNESSGHPRVHIALAMLPGAGHSVQAGRFSESPLLLNPGGPGGSGTLFALNAAAQIQQLLGGDRDVIGFDPRGIGATWPPADCFLDAHGAEDPVSIDERNQIVMRRATWALEEMQIGLANSTDKALARIATHAKATATLCRQSDGEDSILRYAGTPNVARDMLSIVQAWDEWTSGLAGAVEEVEEEEEEQEESSPLGRWVGDDFTTAGPERPIAAPPSTRGKLVYWGISYGTLLGVTFASMFPESVGRLVLDGVVDSERYFDDRGWDGVVRDVDAILQDFYATCHEAKDECRLYREGDTADDVKARFQAVLSRLEEEPLTFVQHATRQPAVLTISDVKRLLFSSMYSPVTSFPLVALLADTLHRGQSVNFFGSAPDLFPLCKLQTRLPQYPDDSNRAISCGDWRALNTTIPGLQATFERMTGTSWFADVVVQIVAHCSDWRIAANDPPEMDWERFPRPGGPPANTSFPILFVSTTKDPITPLQQALIMSQRFVDAGLIEQLSDGHSSLSAFSLCTVGKLRAYINQGKVPSSPELDPVDSSHGGLLTGKWEKCKADQGPWKPYNPPSPQGPRLADDHFLVQEDEGQMMRAWQEVYRAFRQQNVHGEPPLTATLRQFVDMDYELAEMLVDSQQQEDDQSGHGQSGRREDL